MMDAPRSKQGLGVSIFVLGIVSVIFSGCSGTVVNPTLFLPPTVVVQPTSPPVIKEGATDQISPIGSPSPTIDIHCINDLLYIEDMTYPDGTTVKAGTSIIKQWRVKNNGSCNWDARYKFRWISGDNFGSEFETVLFPAKAGTEAIIQVDIKVSDQTGTYQAIWQAFDPSGQPFGELLSIQIEIIP
jgi:hypothetical protein